MEAKTGQAAPRDCQHRATRPGSRWQLRSRNTPPDEAIRSKVVATGATGAARKPPGVPGDSPRPREERQRKFLPPSENTCHGFLLASPARRVELSNVFIRVACSGEDDSMCMYGCPSLKCFHVTSVRVKKSCLVRCGEISENSVLTLARRPTTADGVQRASSQTGRLPPRYSGFGSSVDSTLGCRAQGSGFDPRQTMPAIMGR